MVRNNKTPQNVTRIFVKKCSQILNYTHFLLQLNDLMKTNLRPKKLTCSSRSVLKGAGVPGTLQQLQFFSFQPK